MFTIRQTQTPMTLKTHSLKQLIYKIVLMTDDSNVPPNKNIINIKIVEVENPIHGDINMRKKTIVGF